MLEVHLHGEIISDQISFDECQQYGVVNLRSIRHQLAEAGDSDITINIHSPGGSANEAFAIYDYLKSLPNNVTTKVAGLCASAATIVALAGAKRIMSKNSEFMIHNPSGGIQGGAKDIESYLRLMQATEEKVIKFYAEKTGNEIKALAEWMADEKWMSAEEAKKLGFVTEIEETIYNLYKNSNYEKSIIMANNKEVKEVKSLMQRIEAKMAELLGAKKEQIKNLDLTLEDGTVIFVDTQAESPAVGDAVFIGDDPAPNGEHLLLDGRLVVTEDGVITEIRQAEEESAELMAALQRAENAEAKLADLESEVQAMKTTLETIQANAIKLSSKGGGLTRKPIFKGRSQPTEFTKDDIKERAMAGRGSHFQRKINGYKN